MGEQTKIEWTHHTFNPWIGCTKVHTGCANCYAEAQNGHRKWNGGTWGKGAPRKVTSDGNWKQPLKWARDAARAGERRRVFCASLADVLDEEAPKEAQERLWQLIRETAHLCSGEGDRLNPCRSYGAAVDDGDGDCSGCGRPVGGLDWLLLTKRPERWEIIPEDVRPLAWLGASISNQKTADVFVPRLLAAQGFAKRFISAEPLVGPVTLAWPSSGCLECGVAETRCDEDGCCVTCGVDVPRATEPSVDWVIVGGESGPSARPFDIAWARSLRDQCKAAGVACFVKQLGQRPTGFGPNGFPFQRDMADRKGGDWSEWPEDLRVREFPEVSQ